jgi:hypothetical protein
MIALALAAMLMPMPPQYVEVLELNTVIFCEVESTDMGWTVRADVRLRQWIGWDWDAAGDYHATWWAMYRGEVPAYYDGLWRVRILGRDIVARRLELTVTSYDPELRDRERYPECERRGLADIEKIERETHAMRN